MINDNDDSIIEELEKAFKEIGIDNIPEVDGEELNASTHTKKAIPSINIKKSNTSPDTEIPTITIDNKKLDESIYFEKKIVEIDRLNTIRKTISNWSNSIPNHDLTNLGEKIEISGAYERPSYLIELKTQYETRELKDDLKPYTFEDIPPKTVTADNLDIWSYDVPLPDGFINMEKNYGITGSEEIFECFKCDGQGTLVCNSCDGARIVTCSRCSGEGVIKCSKCRGEGEIKCSKCNGKGETRCGIWGGCGGKGYTGSGKDRRTCPKCKGSGSIPCNSCGSRGYNRCTSCKNGFNVCNRCGGKRVVRCDTCRGNGILTCSQCDGNKKIVKFLYFDDIFKTEVAVNMIANPEVPVDFMKINGSDTTGEYTLPSLSLPDAPPSTVKNKDEDKGEDSDELYDQAVALVVSTQQASISMIHRRLKIGYNRAAHIIKKMEEQGLIGPTDGVTPREVYVRNNNDSVDIKDDDTVNNEDDITNDDEEEDNKKDVEKNEEKKDIKENNLAVSILKESPVVIEILQKGIPENLFHSLNHESLKTAILKLIKSSKSSDNSTHIIKQEFKIYKVNIITVNYTYSSKQYSLLLHGNNYEKVYAKTNPISEIVDDCIASAKNLYKKKDYSQALEVIERAIKISPDRKEAKELKTQIIDTDNFRFKSRLTISGLLIGGLLGFIFYYIPNLNFINDRDIYNGVIFLSVLYFYIIGGKKGYKGVKKTGKIIGIFEGISSLFILGIFYALGGLFLSIIGLEIIFAIGRPFLSAIGIHSRHTFLSIGLAIIYGAYFNIFAIVIRTALSQRKIIKLSGVSIGLILLTLLFIAIDFDTMTKKSSQQVIKKEEEQPQKQNKAITKDESKKTMETSKQKQGEQPKANKKLSSDDLNKKGESLLKTGNYDEAIKTYNQAIKLNSNDVVAYQGRGLAYANKGQHDIAIEDHNKAIKLDPNNAISYFGRGIIFFMNGQSARAIGDHNKAIELEPKYAKTYFARGFTFYTIGQYDTAIEDYNKAIALDSQFAQAYINRGLAYHKKGQYDMAIEDFNIAMIIDPNDVKAYYNRGVAYDNKKQYDKAIEDYNKAISLVPKFTKAYYNRGIAYTNKGQYDMAIEDYNKAIELDPNDAEAYNNRGIAYYGKGQYSDAIKDYNRAIALKPDYADAYTNRGIVYDEKILFDTAIEDYNKAIELDPKYAKAYYNRGLSHEKLGNEQQMINDLKIAAKLGLKGAQDLLKSKGIKW